jgi:hypothetical protein
MIKLKNSMSPSGIQTFVTIALIVVVFILSFRSFALYLLPSFNSDHAVHVLMAQDLVLPEDLYYWGQNRLGSLLPILAHGLIQWFSITPIFAVSYAQYFLLLIGFLSFSSLLKQNISKLIFSLVWFFPVKPFVAIVHPAHPYSPQFALIGCALVLADHLSKKHQRPAWKISFLVFGCITFLSLSLWLSELSIIIVAIVGYFVFLECRNYDKIFRNSNSSAVLIIASVLGFIFISIAKISATNSYQQVNVDSLTLLFKVNNLDKTKFIVQSILNSTISAVTFSIDNSLLSWYFIFSCIFFILFLIISFVFLIKGRMYGFFKSPQASNTFLTSKSRWSIVFGVNAVGTFLLLLNSDWVYMNGVDSRYFSVIYLSVWLAILFGVEQLETHLVQQVKLLCLSLKGNLVKFKQTIFASLLAMATIGSLSLSPSIFSFSHPPSQYEQMKGFRKLEQVGIIGDYWKSYVICTADPVKLHCTPHDKSFPRSQRSVQKVLNSPKIYLVKESWLNDFPDQIEQFGQSLEKQGPEIKIFNLTLAPYVRIQK